MKDFNYEYLARVEGQDKDKRAWRSEMLAFDTARETNNCTKRVGSHKHGQKIVRIESGED